MADHGHVSAEIGAASPEDATGIATALTDAFVDDPVMSWLLPDRSRRPAALAGFFGFEVEQVALLHDASLVVRDGSAVTGAALILPPGHWRTPIRRQAVHGVRLTNVFRRRLGHAIGLQSVLERHHPAEPHYYLPFIGVHRDHQGRGLGGGLLAQLADRCDQERLPAYLEATSPSNVRLYQRHGFQSLDRVRRWGSPPLELMRRAPRKAT